MYGIFVPLQSGYLDAIAKNPEEVLVFKGIRDSM